MEDLLLTLAQQGPLISLLVIAIIYFLKREKKKDDIIEGLHEELRETEKEHLVLMNKLVAYLDKINDNVNDIKNGK